MKKILFSILLSFMVVSCFSQLIIRTSKNRSGVYDEYFRKWRFDEMKYSGISVRVEAGYFQFDDKANSLYRIIKSEGEKVESTHKQTSWICKDENNLECRVQVIHIFEDKSNVISVIYGKLCYVYYIDKIEDLSLKQ